MGRTYLKQRAFQKNGNKLSWGASFNMEVAVLMTLDWKPQAERQGVETRGWQARKNLEWGQRDGRWLGRIEIFCRGPQLRSGVKGFESTKSSHLEFILYLTYRAFTHICFHFSVFYEFKKRVDYWKYQPHTHIQLSSYVVNQGWGNRCFTVLLLCTVLLKCSISSNIGRNSQKIFINFIIFTLT